LTEDDRLVLTEYGSRLGDLLRPQSSCPIGLATEAGRVGGDLRRGEYHTSLEP
jgi:hypothetical protein